MRPHGYCGALNTLETPGAHTSILKSPPQFSSTLADRPHLKLPASEVARFYALATEALAETALRSQCESRVRLDA